MGRKRPRYMCTGNCSMNGVSINGQVFIYLYDCTSRGSETSKYKRELTHVMLRFEDRQWAKDNNLLIFYEHTVQKDKIDRFYTPYHGSVSDSDTK